MRVHIGLCSYFLLEKIIMSFRSFTTPTTPYRRVMCPCTDIALYKLSHVILPPQVRKHHNDVLLHYVMFTDQLPLFLFGE